MCSVEFAYEPCRHCLARTITMLHSNLRGFAKTIEIFQEHLLTRLSVLLTTSSTINLGCPLTNFVLKIKLDLSLSTSLKSHQFTIETSLSSKQRTCITLASRSQDNDQRPNLRLVVDGKLDNICLLDWASWGGLVTCNLLVPSRSLFLILTCPFSPCNCPSRETFGTQTLPTWQIVRGWCSNHHFKRG